MKKIIGVLAVVASLWLFSVAVSAADWNGPYVGVHYGQAENDASGDFDTLGGPAGRF